LDLVLAGAFFIGLLSTMHCLGMCGGIIGALTFSLPVEIRTHRWRLLPYVSAYNLGRLTTYTLAGAVGGALGQELFSRISPNHGHFILQVSAALLMAAIGLYLAGWFPKFALIERLGTPLWKRLDPLGRRLLPVRSPFHAYVFGLIWGWLPCGLIYSALIWTTSSGSALRGALFMLAFGAGTLPSVMTAGILTGWFMRLSRLPRVRQLVGVLIISIALASLALSIEHGFGSAPPRAAHGMETSIT
jgi:sulfite exporter TauE/SafE